MIDIYSKGEYPSNALSNFAAYDFEIDGVKCASMEGFLQSLKFRSVKKQHEICQLVGKEAKLSSGRVRNFIWKFTQTLYWNGRKYKRSSSEYQKLITKSYDCLWDNENFRNTLLSTGDEPLCHSMGGQDKRKTVLTEQEFIGQLNRLRNENGYSR